MEWGQAETLVLLCGNWPAPVHMTESFAVHSVSAPPAYCVQFPASADLGDVLQSLWEQEPHLRFKRVFLTPNRLWLDWRSAEEPTPERTALELLASFLARVGPAHARQYFVLGLSDGWPLTWQSPRPPFYSLFNAGLKVSRRLPSFLFIC